MSSAPHAAAFTLTSPSELRECQQTLLSHAVPLKMQHYLLHVLNSHIFNHNSVGLSVLKVNEVMIISQWGEMPFGKHILQCIERHKNHLNQ